MAELESVRYCTYCGAEIPNPNALVCLKCGGKVGSANAPSGVVASNPPKDPMLMALLSGCCIAGLGQIVLGQVTKGIALLLGNMVLAVMTLGVSALLTWPLMGVDAYLVASRLKEGKAVGEWDFFPTA